MQANSRFPSDKIMYGADSQVIRAKSTAPFLDNVSLVKNQIYQVINKDFCSPEILKAAVIIENLQAHKDDLILSACKILWLNVGLVK